MVGEIFAGKYKILEVLGQGGMSIVYKADDLLLHRVVCIKMLSASYATIANNYLRLQQEARAASKLKHSNIVSVHEFTVTDDQIPYLIIDFVDGISLDHVIKRDGPMSEAQALRAFVQIADALAHAHDNGVVHRDLKPSNIIIENGPDRVPKIVDFGIAKIFAESGAMPTNLTQTGEIFGSPLYMSPEQCNSAKVDYRADMYSFGCVLFEALTGEPPFDAENAIKIAFKHIYERPPSLEDVAKKPFSPLLEGVVAKLLKKQPEQRYSTMAEVCEDLHRLNVGVKPIATKKRTRRRPLIAAALLTVGLAIAISIGIFINHQWQRARRYSLYTDKLTEAKAMIEDAKRNAAKGLHPNASVSLDVARKDCIQALLYSQSPEQTLYAKFGIAETYLAGDDYQEARTYLLEADELDRKTNPNGGPATGYIARGLARTELDGIASAHDPAQAKKHLERALDKPPKQNSGEFIDYVLRRLFDIELKENNYGNAEEYAKRLLAIDQKTYGVSQTTAEAMERLGYMYMQKEEYQKAADWLVPAFKMRLATATLADKHSASEASKPLSHCLHMLKQQKTIDECQEQFDETFAKLELRQQTGGSSDTANSPPATKDKVTPQPASKAASP